MKKIYINGKFFCQRITGTQRYARELLAHFDRLLGSGDYQDILMEILVPPGAQAVPRYASLQVRTVGRSSGTVWEQLELPQYCRGQLLFTPSGGAPILHCRNIVTIHDAAVVAVPRGYSLPYRLWYGGVCRWMGRTAEHIFTVSEFSKSEIVKWYGAPPEKISVAYLGSEHFSRLPADTSALTKFGVTGKYVLAVSSHNPNKNFLRVVEAVKHLNGSGLQLVIAGGQDSKVYGGSGRLPDGVRGLGYVTDAELKALYENAACFVFASLYEGFGLPPLEAMASGCKVVLSRVAALPEVFDGRAVFCDPYKPADIAEAIRRTIASPSESNQLRAFAGEFTWERCARATLDILNRI